MAKQAKSENSKKKTTVKGGLLKCKKTVKIAKVVKCKKTVEVVKIESEKKFLKNVEKPIKIAPKKGETKKLHLKSKRDAPTDSVLRYAPTSNRTKNDARIRRSFPPSASLTELPPELVAHIVGFVFTRTTVMDLECTSKRVHLLFRYMQIWKAMGRYSFTGLTFRLGNEREWWGDPTSDLGCYEASQEETYREWKKRYLSTCVNLGRFRHPHDVPDGVIRHLARDDMVVHTKFRIRGKVCGFPPFAPLYWEVRITANCDNNSLALDDFEFGGKSSLTFSPDTGAVIKEYKVVEFPRKVEGTFLRALSNLKTPRFRGKVGVFVSKGYIAFFRKPYGGSWQSTGFVCDFSWAKDACVCPGIAFRDRGKYTVTTSCIGGIPPFQPLMNAAAYDKTYWLPMTPWEAEDHQ